jgi:hypothetical protein
MHRRQKFHRDLNSTGLMADSHVSAVPLLSQKNSRLAWHGNQRVAASYGVLPKNPIYGAPTKPKFDHRRGKILRRFFYDARRTSARAITLINEGSI